MAKTMISSVRLQDRKELSVYIRSISKFPMLSADTEKYYAEMWCNHRDVNSAQQLVTSHLFLVVKISLRYRGYGFPIMDLIAEGNIGLMRAVRKFHLGKGARLSTYATWWIRAAIQEYVLKNWSLVRIKSSAKNKQLFFSLRSIKNKLCIDDTDGLTHSHVRTLENVLDIDASEIVDANCRLSSRDQYLLPEDENQDYNSLLPMNLATSSLEQSVLDVDEQRYQFSLIKDALRMVDDRARDIFCKRWMSNPPVTLSALSDRYAISCERVRQLENKTLKFIQDYVNNILNRENMDQQTN